MAAVASLRPRCARNGRRPDLPLRLALVGTEVALAAALDRHCSVELYTTVRSHGHDGIPTFPVEALERVKTTHGYDCIVHARGADGGSLRLTAGVHSVVVESHGDLDALAREVVAVARDLPVVGAR
jgi:hypothetical protein